MTAFKDGVSNEVLSITNVVGALQSINLSLMIRVQKKESYYRQSVNGLYQGINGNTINLDLTNRVNI